MFTLQAAQPWIHATASEESLDIIYPNVTASTGEISFTLLISDFEVYPSENLKLKVNVNVHLHSDERSFVTIFQMVPSISSGISIRNQTCDCRNSLIRH